MSDKTIKIQVHELSGEPKEVTMAAGCSVRAALEEAGVDFDRCTVRANGATVHNVDKIILDEDSLITVIFNVQDGR